jgi:stage II sporulation protein R
MNLLCFFHTWIYLLCFSWAFKATFSSPVCANSTSVFGMAGLCCIFLFFCLDMFSPPLICYYSLHSFWKAMRLCEKLVFLKFNSLRFFVFVHNEDSEGTVRRMNSKILVWSYLIILSLGTILNLYIPKSEALAKDSVVIPAEAIRLRILANSDSAQDQEIKRMVRDAVNEQITLWVQELTSMEKAKSVLTSKLPEIQGIAEKVVAEQKSTQSVKVEFGKVQFPTKLYGEFLYPAGEYQAILITLGEGTGANWWCVLYPPLCFLDFSNGVAVRSEGFEDTKTAKAAEPVESVDVVVEESVEEKVSNSSKKPMGEEVQEEVQVEIVEKKQTEVEKEEQEEVEKQVQTNVEKQKETIKKDEPKEVKKVSKKEKKAPVFTAEDEEPVKVKFFVVEMFDSIFK